MRATQIILLFFTSSLLILFTGCATTNSGGVKFAEYRDVTLDNGLKILIVEDHSLPYFTAGLLVGTGGSHDPVGKSGLSAMTASLLDRGTEKKTATEIADAFGQYGTGFSSSVDYDYTYLSTTGLTEDQNGVLSLFFEVITQPSFSDSEVSRLKAETLASIKRSYDEPRQVAGVMFSKFLYGSHPYGRSNGGSFRDVSSIRQKDVIKNYLQHYRPSNAMLVLVGDVDNKTIELVKTLVSKWENRPVENEKLPQLKPLASRQILLASRPDLKQTEVRMGHFGVKRNNEDYQALVVADTILSDGFSSRLMNEIREKRGLTYGIGAVFDARVETGPFLVYTNTRNEKVGEIVTETIRVIEDFYKRGVTEKEVEEAKGYLRGSYPRKIETPAQMAQMLVSLRFYGIADEYMTDYIKNLNKITAKDVNAVIQKYYRPDQLQILIYGPKDQLMEQVRPIGKISVKDYRELL